MDSTIGWFERHKLFTDAATMVSQRGHVAVHSANIAINVELHQQACDRTQNEPHI